MANKPERIRSLRFNQDQGCFTCCSDTTMRIFNVDPLVQKAHYEFDEIGNIRECEMLYRTNFLICIGGSNGGSNYSSNKVVIYDDYKKDYSSILTLDTDVKTTICRRERLFVVLKYKIIVFSFPPPHYKLFQFDTGSNNLGLCQVSPTITADRSLLVFPATQRGYVQIHDLSRTDAYSSSHPVTFKAHVTELACLAMNQTGTYIATASIKGTLIRVWDTFTRTCISEFRRGHDQALLYCINFSHDDRYMCCSSDKGTLHVFNANDNSSHLHSARVSFVKIPLSPQIPSICGFSSTGNTIIGVDLDGYFYKYFFNSHGTSRITYDNFLNVGENDEF